MAALFVDVQLAESTLDLAQADLKSYQRTVDISEIRYNKGAISEDDNLKIEHQLFQFQNDVAQAELAKVQGLSDLRFLSFVKEGRDHLAARAARGIARGEE